MKYFSILIALLFILILPTFLFGQADNAPVEVKYGCECICRVEIPGPDGGGSGGYDERQFETNATNCENGVTCETSFGQTGKTIGCEKKKKVIKETSISGLVLVQTATGTGIMIALLFLAFQFKRSRA